MKKSLINCFVAIFCIIVCGCQRDALYQQLVEIDSLLINEQPDSAYSLIKKIHKEELDEENLAYYHLLLVQSLYKTYQPIASDSIINLALDYYSKTNDKDKLARTFLYKGCILIDLKKNKEVIECLKKAEYAAKESKDFIMLHNIHYMIGIFNLNYNENLLALHYFKQALGYSKITKKGNFLLFDYDKLATCYYELGEKDSALACAKHALKYIEGIPKNQQMELSSTFTVIANKFINIDDSIAEKLLEKAISIKPRGSAYGSLAQLKLRKGNVDEARKLALKGIETCESEEIRYHVTRVLSYIEKKAGNYKRANELSQQAIQLKDTLTKHQQEDNVKAMQITFDNEEEKSLKNRQLYGALMVLVLVALIGGYASWHLRRKKHQAEQLATQKAEEIELLAQSNEQLNEEKRQSIKELESANRKLANAQRKLKEWEAQQKAAQKEQKATDRAMSNGHRLFHELTEGGTTALWHRQDYADFFHFYCQIDGGFREETAQRYDRLTPNAQVMVVLRHLGLTDDELCQRMGLSRAALRTMKWRIQPKNEG